MTLGPDDAGDTREAHRRLPERMTAAGRSSTARRWSTRSASGSIYALMAVGIGLVFGVLRLINFAYGQLIMAGAYTLAFTAYWPVVLEHPHVLRGRDRDLDGDGPASSSARCASSRRR